MKFPSFCVRGEFCILLAMAMLILPPQWLCCWLLATAVHEAGHYAALCFFRVPVYAVTVRPTGVVMDTENMPLLTEGVCAAAGPVAGLTLLLLSDRFPSVAMCGLVQSCFNLLPLYPLDGGRVLAAVLGLCLDPEKVSIIMGVIRWLLLSALLLLSLHMWVAFDAGPIPLLCSFLMIVKSGGKMTCKESEVIVQ